MKKGPPGPLASEGSSSPQTNNLMMRFHNRGLSPHEKKGPGGPCERIWEKRRGRRGTSPRRPRARPREMRVERRPPVSGALLSHGLTPQYHRRSAA